MCLQHSSENVTAAAATREMKTKQDQKGIIHVTVFKSADNIVLHNGIDLCLGSDQPGWYFVRCMETCSEMSEGRAWRKASL